MTLTTFATAVADGGIGGSSRATGRPLGGLDHVRQSIRDILTTPKGSRVLVRDYGSDLPALIDRPLGAALAADVASVAGWVSPNPGGVGPMTRALLLANVVETAERAAG